MGRFVPRLGDRDTGGFFDAAQENRLVYLACADCDSALHPPVAHCRFCGGWNTDWREASGRGTLHSWTTVTHQVHPDYPTPYTLVLVELDGPIPPVRLMGMLPAAGDLSVGLPMEVCFQDVEGVRLPQWRRANDRGGAPRRE